MLCSQTEYHPNQARVSIHYWPAKLSITSCDPRNFVPKGSSNTPHFCPQSGLGLQTQLEPRGSQGPTLVVHRDGPLDQLSIPKTCTNPHFDDRFVRQGLGCNPGAPKHQATVEAFPAKVAYKHQGASSNSAWAEKAPSLCKEHMYQGAVRQHHSSSLHQQDGRYQSPRAQSHSNRDLAGHASKGKLPCHEACSGYPQHRGRCSVTQPSGTRGLETISSTLQENRPLERTSSGRSHCSKVECPDREIHKLAFSPTSSRAGCTIPSVGEKGGICFPPFLPPAKSTKHYQKAEGDCGGSNSTVAISNLVRRSHSDEHKLPHTVTSMSRFTNQPSGCAAPSSSKMRLVAWTLSGNSTSEKVLQAGSRDYYQCAEASHKMWI